MMKTQKPTYDLEERTITFAINVRAFAHKLKNVPGLQSDIQQLIRSSGSVGANYIEANESLGRKDFVMRIRICLKEVKESAYWLKLIKKSTDNQNETINTLINEAVELKNIFAKIIQTTTQKLNLNN